MLATLVTGLKEHREGHHRGRNNHRGEPADQNLRAGEVRQRSEEHEDGPHHGGAGEARSEERNATRLGIRINYERNSSERRSFSLNA